MPRKSFFSDDDALDYFYQLRTKTIDSRNHKLVTWKAFSNEYTEKYPNSSIDKVSRRGDINKFQDKFFTASNKSVDIKQINDSLINILRSKRINDLNAHEILNFIVVILVFQSSINWKNSIKDLKNALTSKIKLCRINDVPFLHINKKGSSAAATFDGNSSFSHRLIAINPIALLLLVHFMKRDVSIENQFEHSDFQLSGILSSIGLKTKKLTNNQWFIQIGRYRAQCDSTVLDINLLQSNIDTTSPKYENLKYIFDNQNRVWSQDLIYPNKSDIFNKSHSRLSEKDSFPEIKKEYIDIFKAALKYNNKSSLNELRYKKNAISSNIFFDVSINYVSYLAYTENRAISTIYKKWQNLIYPFLATSTIRNITETSAESFQEIIEAVISFNIQSEKATAADDAYMNSKLFKQYLVDRNLIEDFELSYEKQGVRLVRPKIINENTFQYLRCSVYANKKFGYHYKLAFDCGLILAYRLGLRSREIQVLRLQNFSLYPKFEIFFFNGTRFRNKSSNAKRTLATSRLNTKENAKLIELYKLNKNYISSSPKQPFISSPVDAGRGFNVGHFSTELNTLMRHVNGFHDFTLHSLRHSFATAYEQELFYDQLITDSGLMLQDAPLNDEVQSIPNDSKAINLFRAMGHSSPHVTYNSYVHLAYTRASLRAANVLYMKDFKFYRNNLQSSRRKLSRFNSHFLSLSPVKQSVRLADFLQDEAIFNFVTFSTDNSHPKVDDHIYSNSRLGSSKSKFTVSHSKKIADALAYNNDFDFIVEKFDEVPKPILENFYVNFNILSNVRSQKGLPRILYQTDSGTRIMNFNSSSDSILMYSVLEYFFDIYDEFKSKENRISDHLVDGFINCLMTFLRRNVSTNNYLTINDYSILESVYEFLIFIFPPSRVYLVFKESSEMRNFDNFDKKHKKIFKSFEPWFPTDYGIRISHPEHSKKARNRALKFHSFSVLNTGHYEEFSIPYFFYFGVRKIKTSNSSSALQVLFSYFLLGLESDELIELIEMAYSTGYAANYENLIISHSKALL